MKVQLLGQFCLFAFKTNCSQCYEVGIVDVDCGSMASQNLAPFVPDTTSISITVTA
ncbi:hypothetical protein I8751_01240 [Nostocaceae cyanobacterium CENA357]|uniref:Uncharacterized protein n=1 Tax=Atlanticothrix silvestris CENA357 TaxID=1725252 RepID=A0A8J7KYH9_9CYAN|nr:hypothetical protein [Atlanticothrix silvestris CENA357]